MAQVKPEPRSEGDQHVWSMNMGEPDVPVAHGMLRSRFPS